MYPVERTISEAGKPLHKQQLSLLFGVYITRKYNLKIYLRTLYSFLEGTSDTCHRM